MSFLSVFDMYNITLCMGTWQRWVDSEIF